jgi:hypothetical protein
MDIVAKLKAGKKNVRKMKWPGTDIDIGLRVLSEAEIQEAAFETERHFKKAGIEVSVQTAIIYDKEQITQTLFQALVNPERTERLFTRADDLRGIFTAPEIKDALVAEFNDLMAECSPSPKTLAEEELKLLFDEVKKNPRSGMNLSLNSLRQLLIFSASQAAASPKDSGSGSTL